MDTKIILVLALNFIIALIGTLAYSARFVGVTTGKIAVSFAVFNILALVSRTAVTFQVPILTKYVENNPSSGDLLNIFNLIIIISGVATIFGAFLLPTCQRIFSKAVIHFSIERSMPKLILHSFTRGGVRYIRDCAATPAKENLTKIDFKKLPWRILIYNVITVALITVGSLAPIFAGTIEPDLSATCITLSAVINGTATILMSIFIDPQLSIMTDDVIEGNCSEEEFKTCIVGMVGSKVIGTFIALPLLVPSSYLIAFVARII